MSKMFSRFQEVSGKKNRAELRKFVENASADELSEMITERICNTSVLKTLDELLQGFTDSEGSQTKKRKIIESVLKSLCKVEATGSHVNNIVNRIVQDFPSDSKANLLKLAEFCHDRIRLRDDNFMSWKDMLPIILQVLEEEKYINYKGNEVSGAEYKSLIVQSICNSPWEPEILTSLTQLFRDISLEKADHELVIRALCDKIRDVELNGIPPLVHQLLRLCSPPDGKLLLGTLKKYFALKYAEVGDSQNMDSLNDIGVVSLKEIQETESTVIYHIYQAAQVNHSRLKDFVTSLKKVTNAPEHILDPFLIGVLLSVINVYEDQILEILKQAMCRKIQDDEKRKNSAWLRSVLPEDGRIVEVIEHVIANSNKDRHLVLQGLVELAFVLMDTDSRMKDDEHQLSELGIRIIQKLIRKRHEIGATVLRKLADKIISGGSAISQYTECLSYICRKLTLVVLDNQAWVITLLELLMTIPGDAAKQVLHAVLPLMRISATIRDSLVLVLRKALYRKGTHTRQMAVVGFLQLLKNSKISEINTLSQSGQSSSTSASSSTSIFTQVTLERRAQSASSNARCNIALCLEVLSILKRCFTHEVEVRTSLYKGLYDTVIMNPESSEYVMDMLLNHFDVFYETDENVKPPLKFHICSNINGAEAVLQEPIGELVFVIQRIYIKMASRSSTALDRAAMILESLCKRTTQTELEHLSIDDQTDLLDNVPKSQQKLHTLKLLITVYEALMAYRIGGWSTESVQVSQNINSLFKSYSELVKFCTRISKPKKGDGKAKKDKDGNDTTLNKRAGRPVGVKLPNTIMNLETIHKMLCLLYEPSVPWATREQSEVLKKRSDFHHYILQTATQLIQSAKLLKNADLQRHRDSNIKDYMEIGELLYKRIICDLDEIRNFDQETGVFGLELFKELCDFICSSSPSDLPKFLSCTCQVEASRGLPTQIQHLLKTLQSLIDSYFEEEKSDEPIEKKIPIIILDTMSIMLRRVSFHNSRANKVFEWLKNLAETKEVETPIATIFVQLLSMMEERDAENGITVDALCMELCDKLGTIVKSDDTTTESFKCLSESSAVQAHGILNAAIKNKLSNASWLLARLKSEQCIASSPGLGDETDREKLREKERSLCRQLSYIIQMQRSLATAAIDPGPNTDSTFKNLQQLYKLLSDLTKYFYNKSTPQNPAFQSVKFVQVVELAGKSLKLDFYNLITHTDEHQNTRRGKSDSHAQRNKVLKETKLIPNVVFAIELFQKDIMQLSKKTGVPLENHLKQSITRDYRINNPQLVEGLEKLDVSLQINTQNSTHVANPDNTFNDDESDNSHSDAPATKKSRLDDSV
ncbi:Fanconi anemia group I protein [Venturia canescens]|uniref:Fanconi anemia group I protein n=1 Tax=Venturia canescens TaxID=32260 RepID=UPI001C9C72A1|nr:Fanconi anemia group I protein [Venturia canescens]XP_043276980.1 Fanconi anemia group I protein [Venturia canescens]